MFIVCVGLNNDFEGRIRYGSDQRLVFVLLDFTFTRLVVVFTGTLFGVVILRKASKADRPAAKGFDDMYLCKTMLKIFSIVCVRNTRSSYSVYGSFSHPKGVVHRMCPILRSWSVIEFAYHSFLPKRAFVSLSSRTSLTLVCPSARYKVSGKIDSSPCMIDATAAVKFPNHAVLSLGARCSQAQLRRWSIARA